MTGWTKEPVVAVGSVWRDRDRRRRDRRVQVRYVYESVVRVRTISKEWKPEVAISLDRFVWSFEPITPPKEQP